ncbi:hypothetical protein [Methylococcus sp. EFPC2]|uniref:hypothetical protein n=1 Tax=Methylococcus sp. EFPC2 TaxID=2812648 RepID=UPI001967CE32|nr:hypothetical protein [Methylococcus sp. EFPC2]QSA97490.1 hypothetical protein JWZ97_01180 [Methylococcus sp. EFPC2]
MSTNPEILRGLRHVVVYAWPGGAFPPAADSPADITLLRAANTAMKRKAEGVTDAFLFLLWVTGDGSKEAEAIKAYGFPEATVEALGASCDDIEGGPDPRELEEHTSARIAKWLAREHPGALAYFGDEYNAMDFWWTGVEYDENLFDWPFEPEELALQLPDTHYCTAHTWLAIVGHAMKVGAMQETNPHNLGQQRAAAIAATLCEWLHGFEGASGNSCNTFDPNSTARALGISEFFLGFEAARISDADLEDFCDTHEEDVDGLNGRALALITSELRGELRAGLSEYFGGDSALFWALHSAIWPHFDHPMIDAVDALLNVQAFNDMAELEAPWMFVSFGWCDSADL